MHQESTSKTDYLIHPDTKLGHVHYIINDLDLQIKFYVNVLGMLLHWQEKDSAGLGAGSDDLLVLTQVRDARRTDRSTGMYHFALLYPSRRELACSVARLFRLRYPNSPTDHVFTKSTYLNDPEGNVIELYVYSLEDGTVFIENGNLRVRRVDGSMSNGREPLDLDALFKELSPTDNLDAPLPPDLQVGHVHIYGSNLNDQMHFYRDILGFRGGWFIPNMRMADVALDHPHIIAFNTWMGEGAPPAPENAAGIRYFTIELPAQVELDKVLERVRRAGLPIEENKDGVMIWDPAHIQVRLIAKAVHK
jgi:catechol 2,3-dioxygenase